ncbi:threonine synthase [Pedobacter frigiditerrae]|uniref:Threonine synthase n=1 Tax=Pedobacter frigiditerrae TaxID=2530452 RepID=A0A4R0N389_9SPHI|nr:threonine synthase [Pedobacter frigiditerrae]TCC94299.1 threonine synthase [Pedobacter frigiditerrae]
MKLYSTNNKDLRVSFQEAVFNSMPQDKGLYMPVEILQLEQEFIDNIEKYSLPEIAYKIASTLLKDEIPAADLKALVEEAANFDAPVVKLDEETFVLELFHGPSLAFKDFGARFMSRIMAYFLKDGEQLLDVLVATSGDTGGAVALGFLGVPNTRVTILFPKGKVSEVQRLQLTTNGKNIRAIAVDGTFDDCQALVKQAFADVELNAKFRLTSANSINIARLIPQTFYYFNAYAQLKRQGFKDVVFSVPSGNFGNIGAGLLAYKMGLPVHQFIAATNANDTVPRFLESGIYETKPSVQTYANAMDVGAPSNWVRIMNLFNDDRNAIQELVKAYSFTDEETLSGINEVFEQFNYVACPHTAIAYLATKTYTEENPGDKSAKVFLSTAHACKFPEVFPVDILKKIQLPTQVESLKNNPELYDELGKDFEEFKGYLLEE